MNKDSEIKIIAKNRKARHDYEILDTIEAGIELRGSEVKSLRQGKINISDAYAYVENGSVFLKNLHISPYKMATVEPHDPLRIRRLLLHKREIRKIKAKTEQQGRTVIPLSIYFKNKLVKIELAIAVGRKKYDKRQEKEKSEADKKLRSIMKKNL